MTLLNTLTNLGGNWPATLALWAVDQLTFKDCVFSKPSNVTDNICDGAEQVKECESSGGKCITEMDGYYIESIVCVIFGFLWLILWGWRTVNRLQNAQEKEWRVVKNH